MEKRKLGKIEVSAIGMGCMGFSHGYGKVPERTYSIEAIRQAADSGCTLFDTAETYGREMFYPGHNEELVGEALHPYRDHAVIATKMHLSNEEAASGKSFYEIAAEHLEASLKRLRTDYVDLYYLHRINELVPVEKVAEGMGRLIEKGLIRGWGLSQVSAETLDRANRVTPVSAVQNIYSMVERGIEKDVLPYCLAHGIGVVPFSPIASGFLSGKVKAGTDFSGDDVRKFVPQLSDENLAANQPVLDVLERFAEEKHATKAQISLAWILYGFPNTVPIPGSKNKERILENLRAADVVLTPQEFRLLQDALDRCRIYGQRGYVESEQNGFSKNWRK